MACFQLFFWFYPAKHPLTSPIHWTCKCQRVCNCDHVSPATAKPQRNRRVNWGLKSQQISMYQFYPTQKMTTVQFGSLLSCVWLFVTPWTAARQASLSITNSQSLLKLMSIESVMPSNHLILCRPILLLPSIFPSIQLFIPSCWTSVSESQFSLA